MAYMKKKTYEMEKRERKPKETRERAERSMKDCEIVFVYSHQLSPSTSKNKEITYKIKGKS